MDEKQFPIISKKSTEINLNEMKIIRILLLTFAIVLLLIYLFLVFKFRILNDVTKGLSKIDMKYLNNFMLISESILLSFYFLIRLNSKR